MGISKEATVAEVLMMSRRRRHREPVLNLIEEELLKCTVNDADDVGLWKQKENVFKSKFSTRHTWNILRTRSEECNWSKGIWFSYATPKFAFLAWLANHNRLSTGDRMMSWGGNSNVGCSFCDVEMETRNHIFFECEYAEAVWKNLAGKLMGDDYSHVWAIVYEMI
ncbi:uncharacterized protein LOC108832354 [Raphanus sativus]|uniref:Uncharacterized protein LOC108832354 n=1 Tax=Raphanus sativus TaxID=3726 RepID=A0A6J0LPR1_RAPSA|nr:uncharacterized protein LOC108832354 [Raphanus sativus]